MNLSPMPELFAARRPEVAARLADAGRAASVVVDADLLALARARVATLVGHPAGDAALAGWPTDPALSQRDRDCLAFVEQYVFDVANVDDDLVANASRHFSDGGFRDFVVALYLTELTLRLELAERALLGPATPSAARTDRRPM